MGTTNALTFLYLRSCHFQRVSAVSEPTGLSDGLLDRSVRPLTV